MKNTFVKFASFLLISSSFVMVSCSNNSKTTLQGEEVFKVNESQFNVAVSFSNFEYYKYHFATGSYQTDTTVNDSKKVLYCEESDVVNYFYVRDIDGYTYLYDWQPSENTYFKYRTGEYNENDGYIMNTIPYYTGNLKYRDFTYKEDKRAYYQELPEGSSIAGIQTRRIYLYFEYQRLTKCELFVYLDETDWQDRTISNIKYTDVTQAISLGGITYVDKGDIGDNM